MHHGSGDWSPAEGFASYVEHFEPWHRTLLRTSLWFTWHGILITTAYEQVYCAMGTSVLRNLFWCVFSVQCIDATACIRSFLSKYF